MTTPRTTVLWVARHGESTGGEQGRYGGAADFPLSERGRIQAHELREAAERLTLDIVFTSPLRRALETAEIVLSGRPNGELVLLDELQEWNSYGVLSGLRPEEALHLFPEQMNAVAGRPQDATAALLGGEPISSFRARVSAAFTKLMRLAERAQGRRCLVVVHGKFLHTLVSDVLCASGNASYRSASLCFLEYRQATARISSKLIPAVGSAQQGVAAMKIYLVRHGEAEDDLDDSYGGAADHRLTPKGEKQANNIAAELSSLGVTHIYTSPLRRARRTAEIVCEEIGLASAVQVVDDLRERNSYGVLSGIPKQKASDLFPLLLKEGEKRSGHSKAPLLGAEDYDAFVARVGDALARVVADATEKKLDRVAVVTHGTFLRVLIADQLGLVFPEDWRHGSSMLLEYEPSKATISPL